MVVTPLRSAVAIVPSVMILVSDEIVLSNLQYGGWYIPVKSRYPCLIPMVCPSIPYYITTLQTSISFLHAYAAYDLSIYFLKHRSAVETHCFKHFQNIALAFPASPTVALGSAVGQLRAQAGAALLCTVRWSTVPGQARSR